MVTVMGFDQQLVSDFQHLSIQAQTKTKSIYEEKHQVGCENDDHSMCTICLEKIELKETALVKGCKHAYCVTCILSWATCNNEPTCPQCKHPFEFLHVYRSLDGSFQDCMFEESVCLLLRASWFKPLTVQERYDDMYDPYAYEDREEALAEFYVTSSSSPWINCRMYNGYVRAVTEEARPVHRLNSPESGNGSSRQTKKKEAVVAKESAGRRAKRALKREAADKAAAEKHQRHLVRLGRK